VKGGLNGHPLRIATMTTLEECVITSISEEAMIAALHNKPRFSELFMQGNRVKDFKRR
jgi:CRP/FNR family transcriptional regulator, cyclic AMP receptor protein